MFYWSYAYPIDLLSAHTTEVRISSSSVNKIRKCTVLWDLMSCGQVKAHQHFGVFCFMLLFAWLTPRIRRCRQYIPPKIWWISTWLHGITSQKYSFIVNCARNSNSIVRRSKILENTTFRVSETLCSVVCYNSRRRTKSKNPVILSVINHRQNPLESNLK